MKDGVELTVRIQQMLQYTNRHNGGRKGRIIVRIEYRLRGDAMKTEHRKGYWQRGRMEHGEYEGERSIGVRKSGERDVIDLLERRLDRE